MLFQFLIKVLRPLQLRRHDTKKQPNALPIREDYAQAVDLDGDHDAPNHIHPAFRNLRIRDAHILVLSIRNDRFPIYKILIDISIIEITSIRFQIYSLVLFIIEMR